MDSLRLNRSLPLQGETNKFNVPVIMLETSVTGTPHSLIIDGNHRVAARVSQSLPQTYVYRIPPEREQQFRLTADELAQSLAGDTAQQERALARFDPLIAHHLRALWSRGYLRAPWISLPITQNTPAPRLAVMPPARRGHLDGLPP
ncbi:hypothetical protein MF271_22110 (plasmid) [Deinococcus sp. KNUC1210]|uniref:hypothetical protein n=1 Tax=Deinococcus sp. KNUC1210 TaxID=2917691 RepID=UPI001EF11D0C|nr:hypothetical protein [Deinococcus sp. KNUC1210]ULH18173.1 hypothetical protein MF271_22110 [Deinococcus sp. KNUC1210]